MKKLKLNLQNYSLGNLINACIHPHYDKDGVGLILLFFKVQTKQIEFKLSKDFVGFQWISKVDLEKIIKNRHHQERKKKAKRRRQNDRLYRAARGCV